VWQARQVRAQVPVLPECFEPSGSREGQGPPRRLIFIGDSIMAGVGHTLVETTFVGQLTAKLAEATGWALQWHNFAHNGCTSFSLLEVLPACLPEADLVLVSCGVNDALRLRRPGTFQRNLQQLALRCPQAHWLWVGAPNLNDFPCLPFPLRNFLAQKLTALARAADQLPHPWSAFQIEVRLTLDTFGPDQFHPGPLGCHHWTRLLLALVINRLASLQPGVGASLQ
jgi:lysophospholipase L1-like esterase